MPIGEPFGLVTPDMLKEWAQWLKKCEYSGWNPKGPLRPIKYRGFVVPYSAELGVGPMWFDELLGKVESVKPIRCAIVGEAGASKTYTAIILSLLLEGIIKTNDPKKPSKPRFHISQVVITGSGYMKLVQGLPPKKCMVLEEPTFHLAARTWFKEWQQIIVQTIESTRFQNNPLMIPVVNRNLLDKIVREYYVNYVIVMFGRGFGRVYRTKHSQWEEKMTRRTAVNIYLPTPGVQLAECNRETCLGCPMLRACHLRMPHEAPICKKKCDRFEEIPKEELRTEKINCIHYGCNKFIWPLYERKRADAIAYYQKIGEAKIEKVETKKLSFKQLANKLLQTPEKYINSKGEYDVVLVRYDLDCTRVEAQQYVRILKAKSPILPS